MRLIEQSFRVILSKMELILCTVTGRDFCEEVSAKAPLLVKWFDHADAWILNRLPIAVIRSDAECEPETFGNHMVSIKESITLTDHNVCLIVRYQLHGLHHAIECEAGQQEHCHAEALP